MVVIIIIVVFVVVFVLVVVIVVVVFVVIISVIISVFIIVAIYIFIIIVIFIICLTTSRTGGPVRKAQRWLPPCHQQRPNAKPRIHNIRHNHIKGWYVCS